MTSRSLSSNRGFAGLLRETLRRNVWAFALSLLGFLFTLPLPVAMVLQSVASRDAAAQAERRESTLSQMQSIFGLENAFAKVVFVALAVVCGVALFSYLHSRQKTDFYHSLPVSRGELFAVNFAAGLCIVVPAYLACLLLGGVIATAAGYGAAFWCLGTLAGAALHLTFFLLLYALSVLCTVLCGNLIVTLLLLGWAVFSPLAAVGLFEAMRGIFYETFVPNGRVTTWLMSRLCPVIQYFGVTEMRDTRAFQVFSNHFDGAARSLWPLLLAYFAAACALTALAFALFRIRKSERAGGAIAFRGLKTPLKLWCTAIMALTAGLLFLAVMNVFWMYIGFLLGAVLTHMLMEIIYAFDFRAAFRHVRTFAAFAVVFALCVLGMKLDLTGYDRYLPDTADLQAAAVESYGTLDQLKLPQNTYANLTDPSNIEAVRAMAAYGISELGQDYSGPTDDIWVRFVRKNGTQIARHYRVLSDTSVLGALAAQIRFSPEYLDKSSELASFTLTGHDRLIVHNQNQAMGLDAAAGYTDDPDAISEIVRTLRAEQQTLTASEVSAESPALMLSLGTLAQEGESTVYYRGNTGYSVITNNYTPVYPSYRETLALIERHTGVRPAPIDPDAVRSVELTLYSSRLTEDEIKAMQDGFVIPEPADAPAAQYEGGAYTVTDKADIAALLQNAVRSDWVDTRYEAEPYVLGGHGFEVSVVFKSGFTTSLYYPVGHAPEAVFDKYF